MQDIDHEDALSVPSNPFISRLNVRRFCTTLKQLVVWYLPPRSVMSQFVLHLCDFHLCYMLFLSEIYSNNGCNQRCDKLKVDTFL